MAAKTEFGERMELCRLIDAAHEAARAVRSTSLAEHRMLPNQPQVDRLVAAAVLDAASGSWLVREVGLAEVARRLREEMTRVGGGEQR